MNGQQLRKLIEEIKQVKPYTRIPENDEMMEVYTFSGNELSGREATEER